MSDHDALDERLRAVERTLTEEDYDLTGVRDAAERTREVESLADRLDEVEERLDQLDAATQALRGYVGNVRAVNDAVERRADAALAKAEEVEADIDGSDAVDAANTRGEMTGTESDQSTTKNRNQTTKTDRGRTTTRDHARPCGCASRPSGRTPTPERDGERDRGTEVGDEQSGVLARFAAALTGLAAPLTGAR